MKISAYVSRREPRETMREAVVRERTIVLRELHMLGTDLARRAAAIIKANAEEIARLENEIKTHDNHIYENGSEQ